MRLPEAFRSLRHRDFRAFYNVARQSFVIEMVGRDDVVNAVALSSAACVWGPAASPRSPGSWALGAGG